MTPRDENRIHRVFVWSVLFKGLDGVVEIGSALILWLVSPATLTAPLLRWATKELTLHPSDAVADYLRHLAESFSIDARSFLALYLLIHGLIKLVFVVGLLRDKAWAYPMALLTLVAFIVYQVYRFTFTHSALLVVLTVFDAIVLVLVWHEYRTRVSARRAEGRRG